MLNAKIDELFDIYNTKRGNIKAFVTKHYNMIDNISNEQTIYEVLMDPIEMDEEVINYKRFKELFKTGKLSQTEFDNITNYVWSTNNTRFLFHTLFVDPYKFVYEGNKRMIRYDKATKIANNFPERITASKESMETAWIYDQILFNSNASFYVTFSELNRLYKNKFKTNVQTDMLNDICVTKRFNNITYYTLTRLNDIEKNICEDLSDLYGYREDFCEDAISNFLNSDTTVPLNTEQQECIRNMVKHKINLITGYPGVGKSTIIESYCRFVIEQNRSSQIYVLAPTGMAVKNVHDKLKKYGNNVSTSTIHKFVYSHTNQEKTINKASKTPLQKRKKNHDPQPPTLIVDESSMINIFMFKEVIKIANEMNANLILIGDINQLPPIGIGEPFKYLIHSELFQTTNLTQIFRQNESQLKDIIKKIIEDPDDIKVEKFDNKSLFFEEITTFNVPVLKNIIKKYALTKNVDEKHNETCKFISPGNNKVAGVTNINKFLQKIYIDPTEKKYENYGEEVIISQFKKTPYEKTKIYKIGDLLVLTKNLPTKNVKKTPKYVNGDYAHLLEVSKPTGDNNRKITVQYISYDEYEEYDEDEFFELFELGYCTTVHKLQGSQFDDIVIIMNNEDWFQWSHNNAINLLYTAVSRAKRRCIFIGEKEFLYKALNTKSKLNEVMLQSLTEELLNVFEVE
jgi:exodeoxyribonuclease V alpha subunit